MQDKFANKLNNIQFYENLSDKFETHKQSFNDYVDLQNV